MYMLMLCLSKLYEAVGRPSVILEMELIKKNKKKNIISTGKGILERELVICSKSIILGFIDKNIYKSGQFCLKSGPK